MKNLSEKDRRDQLRDKIIGLGEKSIRKSYYPELQQRIEELERINKELREEITFRRRAEETNAKLEEQLRQAMKMEAIGTLAGGIAHDFNNILTAIIGYTELARLNIEKDCVAGKCAVDLDLSHLLEAGHRARNLIKQILAFSRQQKQETNPIKLSKVVREALRLLGSTIPKTIEIRERISRDDGHVLADSTQLHQVVMNLCTNGYHAMRDCGGILGVGLSTIEILEDDLRVKHLHLRPGPYTLLEISDTGEGMSRKVQERIFDPYFTTRGDRGGTGMGLAVVHGIVREHKGHISVYSELGKGTTFRVYLPQIIGSIIEHVHAQQIQLPMGQEKILLVDDEELVLDLEKALLEKLGYHVTSTTSPQEALEIFTSRTEDFDLIMTDMTMPKMNGMDLTREILRCCPEIPVIICTGFSELVNEKKAKAIGAREFVMKPLVLQELASTLRRVLQT
jgi:signal transduction histidine kinase/ActR/RegA family two-component response regulator